MVGKHVKITGEKIELDYNKTDICNEGCDPELDVSEVKFFRFLVIHAKNKAA